MDLSSNIKNTNSFVIILILKKNGLEPGEVVAIGDRVIHDISGAASVGMKTVLVDRIGEGILRGWIPADFFDGTRSKELTALKKVREQLKKLGQHGMNNK